MTQDNPLSELERGADERQTDGGLQRLVIGAGVGEHFGPDEDASDQHEHDRGHTARQHPRHQGRKRRHEHDPEQ